MIILETILGVFGAITLLALYYSMDKRLTALENKNRELLK